MKKIVLITGLFCLAVVCYAQSTQTAKGFELQEIIKVAEMYKSAPNLSFNINYTYSDSARTDSILENLSGYTKVSDGRYYTNLDSTEFIQGYQYNLVVSNRDSAIVVNERQDYADLMKVPILDSVFNAQYVDSIKIYSTDDVATNTLHIYLSQNSPYSGYILIYDRRSYRILSMSFYIKNVPTEGGVTSGTGLVHISFSGYSTNTVQQDVFWEDKFIYKQGGEVHLKPAYSGYQLLDNTVIKPTEPILPN